MKIMTGITLSIAILGLTVQANATALNTTAEKAGYATGVEIGQVVKKIDPDNYLDLASIVAGLKQSYAGEPLEMTEQEMKSALEAFGTEQARVNNKRIRENLEKQQAFLAANQHKKGVKTTPSGLQYQVLRAGEGAHPGKDDSVTVYYEGRLIDGTVFDSTNTDKGQKAATFPLKGVIPGCTEGLQLMNKGAKYRFFVPAKLAYGERGAGDKIAPNDTLIFDVELLGINEKAAAAKKTQQ